MGWLFDDCQDEYGHCVRQYIVVAVSFLVFLIGLYSCFRTYLRHKHLTFQLLPLGVNTVTSIIIFALYLQTSMYNTHLILLVVQVYSYSLLTFGLVVMFLKGKETYANRIRIINYCFLAQSVLCALAVVIVAVLGYTGQIKCREEQGVGPASLMLIEVPIYAITLLFTCKNKRKMQNNSSTEPETMNHFESTNTHFLDGEEKFSKIKILQTNLVIFSFTLTILLHIVEIVLYYFVDGQLICENNSRISASSLIEVIILSIENISELFPHFILPVIFWYLPEQIQRTGKTIMIEDYKEDKPVFISNYIDDLPDNRNVTVNKIMESPYRYGKGIMPK